MFHKNKRHSLVINIPHGVNEVEAKECIMEAFQDYNYYAIKHDKDIDVNGVPKTTHYHVVLYSDKRITTERIFTELTRAFLYNTNYDSSLEDLQSCFSDRVVGCETLAIQYLIHKNDKDKYQYSKVDIFTNSPISLKSYLAQKDLLSMGNYEIVQTCLESKSRSEIIMKLGVYNYQKFKSVIDFVMKDKSL